MSNTMTELGKSFQEKIMQALIVDRAWGANFVEIFDSDTCFEYAHLKLLSKKYIEYYNKYKEFPSLELLIPIIKDELKQTADETLKEQIVQFLKKVATNKELGDLGWVKDKAFKYCRQQYMKKALSDSVDLVEDDDKYEVIVENMKKAINAGASTSTGLEYLTDIDARYSETYRKVIATGIKELDSKIILNGGLGSGELGIVVAPTGVGKTHILVNMGAYAILKGKNVVHYTLELNERVTGIRYDSNLTGIPSTDCSDRKEEIRQFFLDNGPDLGRLIIKQLPAKSTTVNTLRAHIEKLRIKEFNPDMIILDYAGIMRSTEHHDILRQELKQIIQEVRDLAEEMDIPIWTALQSNKEGANSEYVDLTNMAEAYAQAHIADFVIGVTRKALNKASGFGTLFVAKNRAGVDGILYKIHLDTSRSKLKILSESEAEAIESALADGAKKATGDGSSYDNESSRFKDTIKNNKDLFQRATTQRGH